MVVDYEVNSSFVRVLDELTKGRQELHHIVLPCRGRLHEEWLVHVDPNRSEKGDVGSSIFVDQQAHWLIGVLPRFAFPDPHIEAGLVEVNY